MIRKIENSTYGLRLYHVEADDHIAIDGILKQDNSTVNDLSAFSFKGRTKGVKAISVIFAYDIERQEPLAAEVFAGNKIDAGNYSDFIERTGIEKGVIIADKGFPASCIESTLEQKPELSYLSSLKRNGTRIKNNKMYDYECSLLGTGKTIQFKKACIEGGRFLYSFKDVVRASQDAKDWIERDKNSDTGLYDVEKFKKKEASV